MFIRAYERDGASMEEPKAYINPSLYDVMLQDLKPEDLRSSISNELGVNYLSSVEGVVEQSRPIKGLVWGYSHRVIVTAPVECFNRDKKNVLFSMFILF